MVTAAMHMLGMKSLGDIPIVEYAPVGENTWMLPETEHKEILQRVAEDVAEKYVYNSSHNTPPDMVH